MNFKKFFSNVIVGLMTIALFSTLSFAMEAELELNKKIVVVTERTLPAVAIEYKAKPCKTNYKLYLLTDENKTIYSNLFLYEGNSPSDLNEAISSLYPNTKSHLRIDWLLTLVGFENKGYGKLLLKNVLDSYKDAIFYLEDECTICQHEKGFCFYKKFGFIGLHEESKIKSEKIEKKYDLGNILILKKYNDNVDYQGNKEGLEQLPIIEI